MTCWLLPQVILGWDGGSILEIIHSKSPPFHTNTLAWELRALHFSHIPFGVYCCCIHPLPIMQLVHRGHSGCNPTTNSGMQKRELGRNTYSLRTRFRTFLPPTRMLGSALTNKNFCVGAQEEVHQECVAGWVLLLLLPREFWESWQLAPSEGERVFFFFLLHVEGEGGKEREKEMAIEHRSSWGGGEGCTTGLLYLSLSLFLFTRVHQGLVFLFSLLLLLLLSHTFSHDSDGCGAAWVQSQSALPDCMVFFSLIFSVARKA